MKRIYFAVIIFSFCFSANAQQFISQGKITFERKVNQWANITDGNFDEQIRKSTPQYRTDIFNLEFDNNQSIYRAVSEVKKNLFNETAFDNIVYSNFQKDENVA